MVTEQIDEKGIPKIEIYPSCEHRCRVENPDGSTYCWICGVTLKEAE
jgi:hypothetical protein